MIPTVSSVPFYSTLIPLLFVLTVTAVKDAYDDIVSPLAAVGGGRGMLMIVALAVGGGGGVY